MRTLVLGIPLPHSTFDNHSFLSAPSLSEYSRVVVDLSAAASVVQEVVDGSGVHETYGGQAIVDGTASAHAFGLTELLAMRKREAERLFAGDGLVVAFGHPQARVKLRDDEEWRTYTWLPEPEGISYETDLLAGFGTPGVVVTDSEHPFAPVVSAVAARAAYRVYLNEDADGAGESARVFARSSGGVAIGFELTVGNGRLIVLPALLKPQADRQIVAQAMIESFDQISQLTSDQTARR
jgi:hypothetical protein